MEKTQKELRTAGEQFPVDIAPLEPKPTAPIEAPILRPARLDAYMLDKYAPHISFGMDAGKTAEMLRDVADRIEKRQYLLQECNILSRAQREDYAMTFLTLVFVQKKTEKA